MGGLNIVRRSMPARRAADDPASRPTRRFATQAASQAQGETFRSHLAAHVRAWERHGIRFGLASWTFPDTAGMLYGTRWHGCDDALRRGLGMYGEVFHTTCIGTGMTEEVLARLGAQAPPDFMFTLVVAGGPMLYRFPYGYPDAARRGEINGNFLDAGALLERSNPILRYLGQHIRTVLLQIAPVPATEELSFGVFLGRLAACLDALPDAYRYAVDMGSVGYLLPEYFSCLRERRVAHALSTALPVSLLDQALMPGALTAGNAVIRVRRDAAPSQVGLQDNVAWRGDGRDPEICLGIVEAVRRCMDEQRELDVYIGEGASRRESTPALLASLMTMLDGDLEKLSPIRKAVKSEQ